MVVWADNFGPSRFGTNGLFKEYKKAIRFFLGLAKVKYRVKQKFADNNDNLKRGKRK